MDTGKKDNQISIAFINDQSPIINAISQGLSISGFEILFISENIEDGIAQLSELKVLPQVCIIDLDFYDKNVLASLQGLKRQYPLIKLIAHSDIDDENVIKMLFEFGFSKYVLIGEDMKKAITTLM